MFDNFIKNIREFVPFTDEEVAYLLSMVEYRGLKKYDKLVRYGEVCNYVSYINKGLVRFYYEANGKEHTPRIFKENEWTGNYVSFLTRTSSDTCLEALEDTEIFQLHYDKIQKAYEYSPVFERLGRRIAESLFIDAVSRYSTGIRKPPEIRYMEMERADPEFLSRIPLKYVASMLGIEPGSLSRIRKRMHGHE
ncbi:MAG: Crp/Fnr family transcriptional regulator [Niabella sp.]